MPGQIARGRRAVLVDHVEKTGAVGVTRERQLEIGILPLETVLGLGDQLGRPLHAGQGDQLPVTVYQGGDHDEHRQDSDYFLAVALEEILGAIHRNLQRFLLFLLCHTFIGF